MKSLVRRLDPAKRALIVAGLVAAIFFSAGYWQSPERPTAGPDHREGWKGYWDQGSYYRSVSALESHNFDPKNHHYPLGYPLLGSLFYSLMPEQPFFIPDFIFFVGFALAFTAIALKFLSPLESVLLCFFAVIRSTMFLHAYVTPWTNIPVNTSLAILAWLVLIGRKDKFAGIVIGICASLIFATRPGDLLYSFPLFAAFWIGCCDWREARQRLLWVVTGALPFTALDVFLSFAIHGSLLSEVYRTSSAFVGLGFKGLPIRLYTFLIDSRVLFPEKNTLVTVYPFLLLIVPGVVVFVKRYLWRAGIVLFTQLACLLFFFTYNDFWIMHVFVFGAIRYIVWIFPFCFFYAYLSIRSAWRTIGVPLTVGLLVLPVLLWTLPNLSLHNVPYHLPSDQAPLWPCVPDRRGTCHLDMEFAEPVEFNVIEVRGVPEVTLTWSKAIVDGKQEQMFRDYFAANQADGETYIFFYDHQKSKSIELIVPATDNPIQQFTLSNLQLAKYRFGVALRNPLRRFHM